MNIWWNRKIKARLYTALRVNPWKKGTQRVKALDVYIRGERRRIFTIPLEPWKYHKDV